MKVCRSCCAPPTCTLCLETLGCNGSPLVDASVTFKSSGTTVASGTSTMQILLTLTSSGSGYTSSPSVTLSGGGGSGATATAAISAGLIVALTVTSQGSGYTSSPTVSFSGGGGSGATATAAYTAAFCATLGPGSYTYDMTAGPSMRTAIAQAVTLTCPGGTIASQQLGSATGYTCTTCGGCAVKNTLTINDPTYGTTTIPFSTGIGWTNVVPKTVTFGGCDGCASQSTKLIYLVTCNTVSGNWELRVSRTCDLSTHPTSNPSTSCPGTADCSGGIGATFITVVVATLKVTSCDPLLMEIDPPGGGTTDIVYCWAAPGITVTI